MLYLCGQMPWPCDSGQKIVTYGDLVTLSAVFEIDVISCIDAIHQDQTSQYLAELRKRCPKVMFLNPVTCHVLEAGIIARGGAFIDGLIRRVPYTVSRFRHNRYSEAVMSAVRSRGYDVLCVDHIHPGYLLRLIPASIRRKLLLCYRAHDILSETLALFRQELRSVGLRCALHVDELICRRYERQLWEAVDIIAPVTRRLGREIVRMYPESKRKIIYLPVSASAARSKRRNDRVGARVLYIGSVHYPPNLSGLQWFLKQCWPLVVQRCPDARLDIVGRGSERLGPVGSSVAVHEHVRDVERFYDEAAVFVVPLFSGSGIRLKVIDALRRGIPVVSTECGYRGLEVNVGRDLLVAETAEGFAANICSVMTDGVLAEELSESGRRFVEENHSQNAAELGANELVGTVERLVGMRVPA